MKRKLKTILLLLASPILYASGRVYLRDAQAITLVFFAIAIGIISYGYLVMPDEEFEGKEKGKLLYPFAFACAGCTTIVKAFLDAYLVRSLPAASIAAVGLWAAVIAFVAIRTSLFKAER